MNNKPSVLFLCSANSARSQMAEALLRKHADDRFEVLSAGIESTSVNPLAIKAMMELGIDISEQRSKSVKEFLGKRGFQHVIFVCDKAEQQCPRMWPGTAKIQSWPFEDPAAVHGSEEERLAKFREVRDLIEAKILTWLGSSQ